MFFFASTCPTFSFTLTFSLQALFLTFFSTFFSSSFPSFWFPWNRKCLLFSFLFPSFLPHWYVMINGVVFSPSFFPFFNSSWFQCIMYTYFSFKKKIFRDLYLSSWSSDLSILGPSLSSIPFKSVLSFSLSLSLTITFSTSKTAAFKSCFPKLLQE